MEVPESVLIVATLSWIVSAISLALLYRKQVKWAKLSFAIVFCLIGSASATYCFFHWRAARERDSAAFLVGVTEGRLEEHITFLESELAPEPAPHNSNQEVTSPGINWSRTFRFKHDDILTELDHVIQNDFIQRYYSVWAADIAFDKHQLDRLADTIGALTEPQPRRITFNTYISNLRASRDFLARLQSELNEDTEQNVEP